MAASAANTPSPPDTAATTPLLKQFWDLKSQAGDALLLFRMGDFYELFGDDAVEASRILEITLTSRDKGKANPLPMAGVPHHSIQGYIQRLLKAGRKVAIGEQMEDPSQLSGRTLVRREITRVFTPGIQFDAEGNEANYLAAIVSHPSAPGTEEQWLLACLDASTGEALVSDPLSTQALVAELSLLPSATSLNGSCPTCPTRSRPRFPPSLGLAKPCSKSCPPTTSRRTRPTTSSGATTASISWARLSRPRRACTRSGS